MSGIQTTSGIVQQLGITIADGIIARAGVERGGASALDLLNAGALAILSAGTGWLKGDGSACGFRDPIALSPNRSPIRADKWTVDGTQIVTGLTLTTINFTIDLKGETGDLMVFTNGSTQYLFAVASGSGNSSLSGSFGSVTYTVDGSAFSGTRGELYTLLAVSGTHDVTITLSILKDLYFGGFPSQAIDGQEVTNLVVNGVEYRQPTATAFTQGTLSKQPLAFPCSPGAEYVTFPGTSGNSMNCGSVTIGANETWEAEVEMMIPDLASYVLPLGGAWSSGANILIYDNNTAVVFSKGAKTGRVSHASIEGVYFTCKYGFDGTDIYAEINGVEFVRASGGDQSGSATFDLMAGYHSLSSKAYNLRSATFKIAGTTVLDLNISRDAPHMAESFTALVGGTITVNQSGQDPAMIVRHPGIVSDDASHLISTLTEGQNGGWVILVAHRLGDGGEPNGRLVALNKTGALDTASTGWITSYRTGSASGGDDLRSYYTASHIAQNDDGFTGNIIHEALANSDGISSRVNGGTAVTASADTSAMDFEEINVFGKRDGESNTTLFLQQVYILPKTFSADTVAAAMPLLAAELGYSYP